MRRGIRVDRRAERTEVPDVLREPILPLPPMSPLEELDVLLALIASDGAGSQEVAFDWMARQRLSAVTGAVRFVRVAATLEDVAAVLLGRPGRFSPTSGEFWLIRGLDSALSALEVRSLTGEGPDAAHLMSLWRELTGRLPHAPRAAWRDREPIDAIPGVDYPSPVLLEDLLGRFRAADCYLDEPSWFQTLHPVRQACRIFARSARLAPFPQHNLLMAWLAACAWLRARAYPLLVLDPCDQRLVLRHVLADPAEGPVEWEERLVVQVRQRAGPFLRQP
jgi:hypothetical protein